MATFSHASTGILALGPTQKTNPVQRAPPGFYSCSIDGFLSFPAIYRVQRKAVFSRSIPFPQTRIAVYKLGTN